MKRVACGQDNPDQAFCGASGSPLSLAEYINKQVSERVAASVRDRNVLETESAIKVFERAWGWVKIVGGIAVALLAIVGGGVIWKVSDWRAVDTAQQSVVGVSTQT